MINNLKFRQIKFQFKGNNWLKLKAKNENHLNYLINRYYPYNAYWSISEWLNPNLSETNKRIILNSDIFIETDNKNIKEVKKILRLMNKKNYKLLYIAFSGRGYHLYHKSKVFEPNYKKREKAYLKEKNEITNYLLKNKCKFDYTTSRDLERVSRIFGSYNGKRNTFCDLIYSNNPKDILGGSKSNNQFVLVNTMTQQQKPVIEKSRKAKSPKLSAHDFFCNKVGKDNYYLTLKSKSLMLSRICQLNKTYNIGELYILKYKQKYLYLSKYTYSKRRIEKIMKFFYRRKENAKRFIQINEKPENIQIIKSDKKGLMPEYMNWFMRLNGYNNEEKFLKPIILTSVGGVA